MSAEAAADLSGWTGNPIIKMPISIVRFVFVIMFNDEKRVKY